MRVAVAVLALAMLFMLGCPVVQNPLEVTVERFSGGAENATVNLYAGERVHLFANMSRYLYAYYYGHAGKPAIRTVEFDVCGSQFAGDFPRNITIFYPQFSAARQVLYAGQLNGCVHVNDSGLLDSLVAMNSSPLECCERGYTDKLEERYPRVYNTTEMLELALWQALRNVTGVNYTCFAGDADRVVTGEPFKDRDMKYGSSSIFNFTCPAYGAEGMYTATVKRVATFNGATYDWADTPGYYVDILIADGGTDERFPLEMAVGTDNNGTLYIYNLTITYNNRLSYSGDELTAEVQGSTPPWVAVGSEISGCTLEAESGVAYSDLDGCAMVGSEAENVTCTDSDVLWSGINDAVLVNSTINYTDFERFEAYDSTFTGGSMLSYFEARGVRYEDSIVYEGSMTFNFSQGDPVSGEQVLPFTYGCNGTGAAWVFEGLDELLIYDVTWIMDNNCSMVLYDSIMGFGGNAAMAGPQRVRLMGGSYFGLVNLTPPIVLEGMEIETDETSAFAVWNSDIVFNNSLALPGTPRFCLLAPASITFSNLDEAYPEIWMVDTVGDSAVYFRDMNFSQYGDYVVTGQYVLGEGFVSFNHTGMPFINETNSTVVLYGVGNFNGQIYHYENYADSIGAIVGNGTLCDAARCTNVRYVAGTLTFDVPGLSSYAALSSPSEGGTEREFDIDVERGCAGEETIFETSVGEVWMDIFGPDSGTTKYGGLRTGADGGAALVIDEPGRYYYSARKSGYAIEEGSFTIAECAGEPAPEEEAAPPESAPEAGIAAGEEGQPETAAGEIEGEIAEEGPAPPEPKEQFVPAEEPIAPEGEADGPAAPSGPGETAIVPGIDLLPVFLLLAVAAAIVYGYRAMKKG